MFYKHLTGKITGKGKGSFFYRVGNEKYMVSYYRIERFGWKLISFIPYNDVMQEINALKIKILTINILVFSIFILISSGLILYMTNPLRKLINDIRQMKIGKYNVGLKKDETLDDVADIVSSFNYMFKRIEELVTIVFEEQKKKHNLEYELLRAQINPHFLFNTLNTIKWSARMSGADHVSKMISSLGVLLEVSINKGEDEIKLQDEVELVQSYLYIQNIRYYDKFKLKLNIDESVKTMKVPKLILQPIIENSIIHGFKNKSVEGMIQINAYINADTLKIEVKDNGEGMSDKRIKQILYNNANEENRQKFSGIGLKNIEERIKLKYGEEYGLQLYSEEGIGTTVILKIPILR
jgi:two-component system sensor histidine kinase YesM